MSFNLSNVQRVAVSAIGALMFATVFVGTAVVPAEAAVSITQPVR